jgi:hypothetical protein
MISQTDREAGVKRAHLFRRSPYEKLTWRLCLLLARKAGICQIHGCRQCDFRTLKSMPSPDFTAEIVPSYLVWRAAA